MPKTKRNKPLCFSIKKNGIIKSRNLICGKVDIFPPFKITLQIRLDSDSWIFKVLNKESESLNEAILYLKEKEEILMNKYQFHYTS